MSLPFRPSRAHGLIAMASVALAAASCAQVLGLEDPAGSLKKGPGNPAGTGAASPDASTGTGAAGSTGSGDTTTASSSGSGGSGGEGGAGGSGSGGAPACDAIPEGPFGSVLFFDGFDGSDDIAFDGLGSLAGKQGGAMILVDADGLPTLLAGEVPFALGTRFAPDGSLIVALPLEGTVVAIDPEGSPSALAEDLSGPNAIHVTNDGVVWVAERVAGRIQTIVPGEDPVEFLSVGEAPAASGIFVDEGRGIVFYTNHSAGEVWRVDIAAATDPRQVASINGALLDGLTMDVCGNIYAVDEGNSVVYRVRTDDAGDLVGEPELIADLPTRVANAQFGRGPGFSSTTLYAAGNPGDVYAIEVGVAGAPQAGPVPRQRLEHRTGADGGWALADRTAVGDSVRLPLRGRAASDAPFAFISR